MSAKANRESDLSGRLDTVIDLLQDLFILQALNSRMGRDSIRRILGVRTTRVSKITKGLKQARKHAKENA